MGNNGNEKSSKKAKFRTASVLAHQLPEMETNPDLIPKHGKTLTTRFI